jgi:hypothetical protein
MEFVFLRWSVASGPKRKRPRSLLNVAFIYAGNDRILHWGSRKAPTQFRVQYNRPPFENRERRHTTWGEESSKQVLRVLHERDNSSGAGG